MKNSFRATCFFILKRIVSDLFIVFYMKFVDSYSLDYGSASQSHDRLIGIFIEVYKNFILANLFSRFVE